jgi:plastocyanin
MFATRRSSRLIALPVVLAVAACGGGGDTGATGDTGAAGGDAGAAPAAVANAGTISGTVNFTGMAPANAAIDMGAEPTCAAKHPGGATVETVVAANGKLANVFVYLKEGVTGTHTAPATNIEVDQQGCVYLPHISGVMVGQGIAFKNSDGLAHNVKSQPVNNRPFNISQPTNMTSAPQRFSTPEIMIPVQCDVHGWMQSYVGVVAHPYFAVSGADGNFTIGNVAPGTYTMEAWHERYGVKTAQVTVDPSGTATVTFDYDAAMANAVVPMGEPFDPHTDVAADRRVAQTQPATR